MPNDFSRSAYVVKTHFPQNVSTPEMQEALQKLLNADTIVVTTTRDTGDIFKSHLKFTDLHRSVSPNLHQESITRFDDYWHSKPKLTIRFEHMTDSKYHVECITKIASQLGQEVPGRVVGPYLKNQRIRVYCSKALTRILGKRAPVINTTFYFGQ
jgi:hypothetical protein